MSMVNTDSFLTSRERLWWRGVQIAVWLIGTTSFVLLIAWPKLGLSMFWSVLIPVAPALLVFAPGVWRNVCPLASTALLSRHVVTKRERRKISVQAQGVLTLIGVGLLFVIVLLRHVIFDTSGIATAMLLGGATLVAVGVCWVYEWKSAWCSGLCPVHPVEKLYGQRPCVSLKNAHCHSCHRCVQVCPDSTPEMSPLVSPDTWMHRLAGVIMVGGFAGFVWGWFHVPDYAGGEGWQHLGQVFGWPMGGLGVSLSLYLVLRGVVGDQNKRMLTRLFAGGAVACYYWYRLPGLVGFGLFPGDGMLVDLAGTLPEWIVMASQIGSAAILILWLMSGRQVRRSWTKRPPYASTESIEGSPGSVEVSLGIDSGLGESVLSE